jgi:hypothetical protein
MTLTAGVKATSLAGGFMEPSMPYVAKQDEYHDPATNLGTP